MIGAYAINTLETNVSGLDVRRERFDGLSLNLLPLMVVTLVPPLNAAAPTPLYIDIHGVSRPAAYPAGFTTASVIRFTHPSIRFLRSGGLEMLVFPAPFVVFQRATYGDETCAPVSARVTVAPARTFTAAPARRLC